MSDRSMGVLQQADEERARRKDNPEGWPEAKERLEKLAEAYEYDGNEGLSAAIRAALQRVEELSYSLEMSRAAVEELEQQLELRKENLAYEFSRAEKAEAQVKELEEEIGYWRGKRQAVETAILKRALSTEEDR